MWFSISLLWLLRSGERTGRAQCGVWRDEQLLGACCGDDGIVTASENAGTVVWPIVIG